MFSSSAASAACVSPARYRSERGAPPSLSQLASWSRVGDLSRGPSLICLRVWHDNRGTARGLAFMAGLKRSDLYLEGSWFCYSRDDFIDLTPASPDRLTEPAAGRPVQDFPLRWGPRSLAGARSRRCRRGDCADGRRVILIGPGRRFTTCRDDKGKNHKCSTDQNFGYRGSGQFTKVVDLLSERLGGAAAPRQELNQANGNCPRLFLCPSPARQSRNQGSQSLRGRVSRQRR